MSLITPSGTEVMSGSSALGDFFFFGFGGKLPYLRCKSSHSVDSPSARRYDVDAASKGQVLVHRETRMKSDLFEHTPATPNEGATIPANFAYILRLTYIFVVKWKGWVVVATSSYNDALLLHKPDCTHRLATDSDHWTTRAEPLIQPILYI